MNLKSSMFTIIKRSNSIYHTNNFSNYIYYSKLKDKEEWMKAFRKTKDVRFTDKTNEIYPDQITNMKQIGV